jgi:hypothetical protein
MQEPPHTVTMWILPIFELIRSASAADSIARLLQASHGRQAAERSTGFDFFREAYRMRPIADDNSHQRTDKPSANPWPLAVDSGHRGARNLQPVFMLTLIVVIKIIMAKTRA